MSAGAWLATADMRKSLRNRGASPSGVLWTLFSSAVFLTSAVRTNLWYLTTGFQKTNVHMPNGGGSGATGGVNSPPSSPAAIAYGELDDAVQASALLHARHEAFESARRELESFERANPTWRHAVFDFFGARTIVVSRVVTRGGGLARTRRQSRVGTFPHTFIRRQRRGAPD